MKAGAENKTKLRFAIGLGIVALLIVARTLMPAGQPSPEPAAATAAPAEKGKAALASESLDPRLRLDLLASSEQIQYEGKGTNIFRFRVEAPAPIPQAKVPVLTAEQQQQQEEEAHRPPPPPPPPPIDLKYFGISSSKGEKPKAFLTQGDDIWVAREGDVVNRQYKIVRISPTAVEVEDLLNNHRQSIPRAPA